MPEACLSALLEHGTVYRRRDSLPAALQGYGDIDFYVDKSSYNEFRDALHDCNALQSKLHPSHDNVRNGREEWFIAVPDAKAPVHFDVLTELCVGPRFNQSLKLPVIEGAEADYVETVLAVCKAVFSVRALIPFGSVPMPDLSNKREDVTVVGVSAKIDWSLGRPRISALDLRTVKEAILKSNSASGLTQRFALWARHFARQGTYIASRLAQELGFAVTPKRRPMTRGAVVAVVGADGVGKSTQIANMQGYFSSKFSTRSLYLGHTGVLSKIVLELRGSKKPRKHKKSKAKRAGFSLHAQDAARSLWGITLGIIRYHKVKRAVKLAAKGYLVICDRWPQSLERGYLDGPIRRVTEKTFAPIELLFSLEARLYKFLDRYSPDLCIHLVAPFETLEARKPGELNQADFNSRTNLLDRLRTLNPMIKTVDVAKNSADEVFAIILADKYKFLLVSKTELP